MNVINSTPAYMKVAQTGNLKSVSAYDWMEVLKTILTLGMYALKKSADVDAAVHMTINIVETFDRHAKCNQDSMRESPQSITVMLGDQSVRFFNNNGHVKYHIVGTEQEVELHYESVESLAHALRDDILNEDEYDRHLEQETSFRKALTNIRETPNNKKEVTDAEYVLAAWNMHGAEKSHIPRSEASDDGSTKVIDSLEERFKELKGMELSNRITHFKEKRE